MVAAKPDCTGQKFGHLTVLGKGSRVKYKKHNRNETYRFLWRLQCDCGRVVELSRGDFDRRSGSGQKTCGCALANVNRGKKVKDITGQKFGNLKALKLTGKRDKNNKPTWSFECDCGGTRELSYSRILSMERYVIRINCGNRQKHEERYLEYPPTPKPYPHAAGKLMEKYLYLCELINYEKIDSEVQDEKRDRLLRACWILTYRREQGETLSEIYEKRFIKKHLRYSSIDVFWKRKLQNNGGLIYTNFDDKKELGDSMTTVTYNDYPALEVRGQILMSEKSPKKFKFKRV